MDTELLEQVAYLLGWRQQSRPHIVGGKLCEYTVWTGYDHADHSLSEITVDLLESEIEQRGLQTPYVLTIMDAIVRTNGTPDRVHWHLLRATPEQRARAFVAVMTEIPRPCAPL